MAKLAVTATISFVGGNLSTCTGLYCTTDKYDAKELSAFWVVRCHKGRNRSRK